MITTHSAHVFLVGDHAFKIKRAVRYNYLNFSTLEARRKVIAHELDLNAPSAPAIYDRVVTITREATGRLALDGNGEPVEYAPADAPVSPRGRTDLHRRRRQSGQRPCPSGWAMSSPISHAAAEKRPFDGAVLISEIVDELREAFAGMESALGRDRLATFLRRTDRTYGDVASLLFATFLVKGRVRRCHGDLQSEKPGHDRGAAGAL